MEQISNAFDAEGESSFRREHTHLFLQWLISRVQGGALLTDGSRALLAHLELLLSTSDMRKPAMAYSAARSIKRSIHLHVGPTNSGKTHGALVALCKARTGMYAGPLRLLAHEVWDRINAGTVSPGVKPRTCNLVTGEEVRMTDDFAGLVACTVEMANLEKPCDVAVIDEIQMIGDAQRGSAWTAAVLGIPARELHLCGESSVVPLLRNMADACGDELEVHEYERLTPLNLGEDLDGKLENVRRGDCVVAFSRSLLFSLKRDIELRTGLRCAIAYGALPPETKSEQAKIFNDPNSGVDVMVASDAVGMGLNLKIKRVVFSSVTKWNGNEMVPISTSQLKQIAGRAGRYGTSSEDTGGLATTLWPRDLDVVRKALEAPLVPITRAAIQPSSDALASFSTVLPRLADGHRPRPLSMLLDDVSTLSRIDSRSYFLASLEQQLVIAPIVERASPASAKLSISEHERFSVAPANIRDERLMILLSHMVTAYASGNLIKFQDVERGLGMLDVLREVQDPSSRQRGDVNSLMILESLHRGMTLYLWLSFRFPLSFCARPEVEALKVEAEKAIDDCLDAIRAGRKTRLAKRAAQEERGESGQKGAVDV
ncbi:P-loop containing nucleoside triphosphate hydrolase protein [Acaromyces ingoldii]|uniref:RNA helicase n=1 Tax=Acaromyces ingoldii TaxID=215250 RepID=A0A316YCY3_9BASI|nr:P-loop containing nucleoside triphosphate hydrolase protein [Acaromyces ingoldii]PWN87089.1 P-loop containing nucleoside triphosphate hydrolase protein [Acaromyces ingoldii]